MGQVAWRIVTASLCCGGCDGDGLAMGGRSRRAHATKKEFGGESGKDDIKVGKLGGGSVREAHSGVAGDDDGRASASMASASECGKYVTTGMSEVQIAAAIVKSEQQGWTELKDGVRDGAAASRQDDQLVWEELKTRYPNVFQDSSELGLELGRVIAEGGQATIYEAKLSETEGWDMVAKVFKMEGFSLADLQRQWPRATKTPMDADIMDADVMDAVLSDWRPFVMGGVVFSEIKRNWYLIHFCTILKGGRFAFIMRRYWGDLRALIDLKLMDNNSQGPPFLQSQAVHLMSDISKGMRDLHARGALHRDLKAANVLINFESNIGDPRSYDGLYECHVADFESAMFVQGTTFWRAPEVLEDLQKEASARNANIWTEKVDVYSFAMTCYEVLTGDIPFKGYVKSDWKRIIDGERPHLPNYIDPRVRDLVERCWHKEPSQRPTFQVIEDELEALCRRILNIMLEDELEAFCCA